MQMSAHTADSPSQPVPKYSGARGKGSFKYLEYTIFVIHLYVLQILGGKVRNKVLYIK